MILFTAHAFFLIDHEYANYVRWRLHFLTQARVDDRRFQPRYTVLIEGLPEKLKTNRSLERYLNKIFPGQLFCANVQLEIGALEKLHERRLVIVDALERAVAFERVTGQVKSLHLFGPHWPRWEWWERLTCAGIDVKAVPYLRKELERLNDETGALQMAIHAEQRSDSEGFFDDSASDSPPPCGTDDRESPFSLLRHRTHVFKEEATATPVAQEETTGLLSKKSQEDAVGALDDKAGGSALGCLAHVTKSLLHEAGQSVVVLHSCMRCLIEGLDGLGGSESSITAAESIHRSDTAFATFTSSSAIKSICSVSLTHRPNLLKVSPAPDARDMLWCNVSVTRKEAKVRQWVATFAYVVAGACWSIVVWFCSSLGQSAEGIMSALGIDSKSQAFSLVVGYLPITLQLGLLALVPVIVQFTSTFLEGTKSRVEVQKVIYQR